MSRKVVLISVAAGALAVMIAVVNPEMEPFTLASHPLPEMPERPAAQQISPTVTKYVASLPIDHEQPGGANRVWIYLPKAKEDQPQKNYPCLFYTSAGAAIFGGMLLSEADELEIMPYVHLGFAVVCYEVDGDLVMNQHTTPEQMVDAAEAYFASSAGLVNARNAMHFALDRFP